MITYEEKRPIQDHCGIVAAYAPSDVDFFSRGLAGLSVLQTRGYDGAGFCALDTKGELTQHKGVGMVREVFAPDVVRSFVSLRAQSWVYQVRYGTSGGFVAENVQPIVTKHTKTGETFIVAHNGQFSDTPDGEKRTESDTLLFCQQLAEHTGATWEQRIVSLLSQKQGAWSLLISTPKALYVARDQWGIRPFTYGHVLDPSTNKYIWAAASETSALDAMGITEHFELLPGTIAKISDKGLEIIAKTGKAQSALCIFENIYLQHGAGKAHIPRNNQRAIKKSPTVDEVRRRSGKILAREAPLSRDDVDIVVGVPGTGIESGMAYARVLDIPYFQAITDRNGTLTEQRTFMTANIDSIYQKVLEHFRFDGEALKYKRVALVDDSIVRGNITKGLVYLLKHQYHVRAVHFRIVSPPIDKACYLGVNTRNASELVAAQFGGDAEKIRAYIEAESLAYLSAEGLKEALTGDPHAKGFCMGCMTGFRPPIDVYGQKIRAKKLIPTKPAHTRIAPEALAQFVYKTKYEGL